MFFHSDLAQMAGKMPVSVDDMKIDVASLSSHKIYGPKGMGAIYIRRRPRVRLEGELNCHMNTPLFPPLPYKYGRMKAAAI